MSLARLYSPVLLFLTACAASCAAPRDTVFDVVVESIDGPLAPDGRFPSLFPLRSGAVLASWVEPMGDSHRLRVSTLRDERWSEPSTVAEGRDWFVNWADFPTIAESSEGTFFATWLAKNGKGTYAYSVWFARSKDAGETWSSPRVLHEDQSESEHGFVSLVPLERGRVAAVWLDGRPQVGAPRAGGAGHGHALTALYSRVIEADGSLSAETVIDARVCDCCQTDAVRTSDGAMIVAYRGRTPDEVRDIHVVRQRPGREAGFTVPISIRDDGWRTPGCPVNGPALASDGRRVALVWYTHGHDEKPRVLVSFSEDRGRSFQAPTRVDDGSPLGRVDARFASNGALVVTWLETQGGVAEWRARAMTPGTAGASKKIATASGLRLDGFLRMAPSGDSILAAWTDRFEGCLGAARLRVEAE